MRLEGRRVAVFGLGRSGLGVARAVQALGGRPEVFDEQPREALAKPELAEEAEKDGIAVAFGWDGRLEGAYAYLVANPAVDARHPTLRAVAASGVPVLSEIEFAYRIAMAPIVAVTGTNGKSTTTVMTTLALLECGEEAVLCGNVFGTGYHERPLTDAALASPYDRVLVAEVSSFQLDGVDEFRPVSAGITNISPDHLDRYDAFEDYAAAKRRIFARQGPDDAAVLPAGDPLVPDPLRPDPIGPDPIGPRVFRFGDPGADAYASASDLHVLGARAPIADLPFQGAHDLANAQTAALLAFGYLRAKALRDPASNAASLLREHGVDLAAPRPGPCPAPILAGLKRFKGLAHRMERVGERAGVAAVNNSMCTNPGAVIASVGSLRGRAHVLLGGANKGLDFAPLRAFFAGRSDALYLFGRDAGELAEAIGGATARFETLAQAFEAASRAARAGETIILAPGCLSTDQFRDFRDRGDAFRRLAKEWSAR